VKRAALGAVALAALLAGCGSQSTAPPPTPPPATATTTPVSPAPPKPHPRFRVLIADGDTGLPVAGAIVRIGGWGMGTGPNGRASVRISPRRSFVVRVAAPGYSAKALRLPYRRGDRQRISLYRPSMQWTMYGVVPARTQAHPAISVRPPFRVVWSRGLGTLVEFPAVVSDGVAYIGNNLGTVRAISMTDGRVVWRRAIRGGRMAASPAVVGDDLVVHGMDGYVRVLDRQNGRVRWSYRIGSPIESSPVVADGVDYFGAWDGDVYALDLRQHRLRWTFRSGYKITSSAALVGGRIYIGDYGGRLIVLAAANGRPLWLRSVNGRVYGTPAVAAGRVFVPSSDGGSLTAFTTGGQELWRVATGSYVYSSPAVWGGRVFFGSYNGLFYGVSARTGATLWTVGTGGPISGAAVVVDGVAYAGSFSHRIVGVDARTGRTLLSFPHGEYVPVSGNGGRLLLHGYSRLYAVVPIARRR
jgi:outer membrane protein assembly factor BamB